MSFGIIVNDANGVQILGMEDFTLRKIYETTFPATGVSAWTLGVKSDYDVLSIPGYSASTCFVVITPLTYYTTDQSQAENPMYTPTYVDLGGETIGIVRYIQDTWYDISNQRFRDRWRWCAIDSIVEVYKYSGV